MCSDPDSTPTHRTGARRPARRVARSTCTAADGDRAGRLPGRCPRAERGGHLVLPDYHGLTPFYERAGAARSPRSGSTPWPSTTTAARPRPPPRDASFDHVAPRPAHDLGRARGRRRRGCRRSCARARGSRALFSVGFCFGGRASFLLGTVPDLALAGVIGFYGWPVGAFGNDTPAPADVADASCECRCWASSVAPTPRSGRPTCDDLRARPHRGRREHRIVSYEGAPHSFFDRQQAAHADASAEAWSRGASTSSRSRAVGVGGAQAPFSTSSS